jgi:cold shock CspA family protein
MSSSLETTDKVVGHVKWFNNKTGYGFISAREGEHNGKDVFTHYSSIRANDAQYKYLVQGEYVDFTIIKSSTGNHEYQSADVTGIKGGALMCETRQLNQPADSATRTRRYQTRPTNDRKPKVSGDNQPQVEVPSSV